MYEEQGYEDAAYDHGGYKKAAEHHEKKIIPGEHKTDYVRIIDQSTEQAEVVNFGPRSTTDSSHFATTTEKIQNRKPKRPKSQRNSWAWHRQSVKQKNTTKSQNRSPVQKRRTLKSNKNTTDENRIMQESNYYTTRKLITELNIAPTTYRPVLLESLNLSKTKQFQHMPFKPPKVSKEGYKFEFPFENFKDFNEIRTTSPLLVFTTKKISNTNKLYFPSRQYQVQEIIKYGESRDIEKTYPYDIAKSEPELTNPRKVKHFPYKIVDSKKSRDDKKKYEKRVNFNFPYKIIGPAEPITYSTPKPFQLNSENYKPQNFQENRESIFGQPDDSPWIPITSKEVYDIHGYESKRVASEVKVKEEVEPVSELVPKKKLSPIKVYNVPTIVNTNYAIEHVYKPKKYPTKHSLPADYDKTYYHYDMPDVAESVNKLNTFKEIMPVGEYFHDSWKLPSTPNSATSVSFVTTHSPRDKTTPLYDIITAYTSDIRTSYQTDRNNGTIELTQATFNISESSNISTTPSIIPKDRELLEDDAKDIDTLSSNRYAIFKRVNFTMPMESTTATIKEINDEFNRMFLDERDKFLFRHPHLSRETSRFIKAKPEETTRNATTAKRDIVMTNVQNSNVTHLTKMSKRNDLHAQPVLVYPEDYASSAKYVERLTLAHFSSPENVGYNSLPLDYIDRVTSLTNHLNTDPKRKKRDLEEDINNSKNEELVSVIIGDTTTTIPVNVRKYPFYKKIPKHGLAKYSVLRYISNPLEIPAKKSGQMTFYESRNKVQCSEPVPPENIVPQRQNGEWAFNPKPTLPRIQLGDKIACFKMKFFGSEPLDNPFFKEESIDFPEIFEDKSVLKVSAIEERNENIDDIEDARNQFVHEVLPEGGITSKKKQKLFKTKKTEQFKRSTVETPETETLTRSPIRQWIELLAKSRNSESDVTPVVQKLSKRSLKEKLDKNGQQVQKIIFVGGFLNQQNLNKNITKKISSTELPYTSSTKLSDLNELKFNKFASYPDIQMTTNTKAVNDFNKEFTFTPVPTDTLSTTNSAEDLLDDDSAYVTDAFQEIIKVKLGGPSHIVDTFSGNNENDTKYLPSESRIVTKSKTNKKYIDVLSSLRNLHSSNTSYLNTEDTRYKSRWHPSNQTKKLQDSVSSHTRPEIDSLLYVIHPKTGEGKWMKLLKVEEVDDNPTDSKTDSLDINNDERTVTYEYPAYLSTNDNQEGSQSFYGHQPCRDEKHEIKMPPTSEYDVSKINILVKNLDFISKR